MFPSLLAVIMPHAADTRCCGGVHMSSRGRHAAVPSSENDAPPMMSPTTRRRRSRDDERGIAGDVAPARREFARRAAAFFRYVARRCLMPSQPRSCSQQPQRDEAAYSFNAHTAVCHQSTRATPARLLLIDALFLFHATHYFSSIIATPAR